MNDIQIWDFQGNEVRTVEVDGVTWWALKDIAQVLGIVNNRDITQRLEEDEVGRFDIPHPQSPEKKLEMTFVNEYGLYETLFRSDKPNARTFRKWVTHEVLPAIRNKGYYALENAEPAPTVTSKAYAYLDIARMVSRCRTERLPLVMGILEIGGWELPEIERAKEGIDLPEPREMRDLSEKIQRVMDKYGLKLFTIASLVGEHHVTMSRYYRRVSFPKPEKYKKIAEKLDDIYENGMNAQ